MAVRTAVLMILFMSDYSFFYRVCCLIRFKVTFLFSFLDSFAKDIELPSLLMSKALMSFLPCCCDFVSFVCAGGLSLFRPTFAQLALNHLRHLLRLYSPKIFCRRVCSALPRSARSVIFPCGSMRMLSGMASIL